MLSHSLQDSATKLLHGLCDENGIRASLSDEGNYTAVFARDAVMAGIYGLLSSEDRITEGLIRSLEGFRRTQGGQGQIASNYTYRNGELEAVSYGTLCMKMDAITWYVLGVALAVEHGKTNRDDWSDSLQQAIELMDALEYNGRHLLYVPAGGNWADEYPYQGYVLYDQALRIWALRKAGEVFENAAWSQKSDSILEVVERNFWPKTDAAGVIQPRIFETWIESNPDPHYATSFNPTGYFWGFDLAANTLMALAHPKARAKEVLDWISETFLSEAGLPPVFHPTIQPGEPLWNELRQFYIYVFKNEPGHYHNGGIWPIWLGWLSLALKKHGLAESAERLQQNLLHAIANQSDYGFEEYFDGIEMKSGGTRRMAYSATGILMTALDPENLESL